uniref:G_PROTEIN_RECEP_F1_2 domain-containing protein n=2 Tax=Bursaphelenchus xylophilus TaxID=6326 RepID=A0A1I7S0M5_BURXY
MLHQSTHWVYLANSVFGQHFIPFYKCFEMDFVLAAGATISALATLYVGIDRLIGVAFPVTYKQLNRVAYVGGLFLVSLVYAGFVVYLGYEHTMSEFRDEPVLCRIIDSFGGKSRDAWFLMCIAVNLLDVIVYVTVWILLKRRTAANDSMRRVFKSLIVMMFTVVLGWMLNAFVVAVVLPHIPIERWFYYESYFGILINVASSGNVVILYCLSGEYRATFREMFNLPDKPSKAAPVSTVGPASQMEGWKTTD